MTPATHAPHRRAPRSVLVTAALLALGLAACGQDTTPSARPAPTPAPAVTTAATALERPTELVDERIAIDSGTLHIHCRGSGTTTVLLIAGWGGGEGGWGAVEPAVAETARVCSYARFGTGTSDPPATTQTFATQAADLHELLREAAEPGPYVLVGHSFGGAQAVTFASQYADEVAGLMLVDASPVTWPATVCSVPAYEAGCAVMHDPTLDAERLDAFAAFDAVATISSLGDLPMTVMTAARRTDPALTPDELTRLDAIWAEGVERWAALSTSSTIVSVENTGHDIHVDQPGVVIGELLELLP